MAYKTKPYKEAYPGQIRALAYCYGLGYLATCQLEHKVNIKNPLCLIERNKNRAKKIWRIYFRIKIKRFTPKRVLPLP